MFDQFTIVRAHSLSELNCSTFAIKSELKEINEEKKKEKKTKENFTRKMIESELFIGMVNLDTNMKVRIINNLFKIKG